MSETLFETCTLDRRRVRWEDQLLRPTPVERRGSLWFKRDDYFAPLGANGINGGKVRQTLWLALERLRRDPETTGLMVAASVKSPQIGMTAAIGRHLGLPVVVVIGSRTTTAWKHENVLTALELGAKFEHVPVAYNPALQRSARDLHAEHYPGYYRMEYALSVEGDPERMEAFYRVGSEQARNLPPEVTTLLVPAGSCNSMLAVLYGLARHRPGQVSDVVLFGIGPNRVRWYEERLKLLGIEWMFRREYPDQQLQDEYGGRARPPARGGAPFRLRYFDLHRSGFATYQDEMPESYHGLDLHPTYEGKIMRYMRQHAATFERELYDGSACFWVVGKQPRLAAMRTNLRGATAC